MKVDRYSQSTLFRRSNVFCSFSALVALWCSLAPAFAQTDKPTVVSEAPPKEQLPGNPRVPLLSQPLHLSDFTSGADGMQPAPALAAQLGHVSGFIQSTPVDGRKATEDTEVWMGRTNAALYFVFLCHDDHPDEIRTHLARRENISKDDSVTVLLDPFEDHRRGTLFSLNASGVQADAAWTENSNPDYSYDQVWDSDGRVTPHGWLALFAIPLKSLRFRPDASTWGVVFRRNLQRNSERDFWPRIAGNVSGTLTQEGTLTGLEVAHGSHEIQLNPYGLAQNERRLNLLDPFAPYFSKRKLEATAGGDAKAVIHSSIVLDATINPDFSQVESDQPQFTVNQRFPVFFPELRPFFLENANYFSTPITLLYTRNIVHPEFGARLTGKLGHTNLGLLLIDDRAPGEAYARADARFGKHALFAVGRVSVDVGKGSNLGLIYADEEFAASSNRVGGFDFTARFNDHWTAVGQTVESSTRSPVAADGTQSYSAGPASKLDFSRDGHSFNFDNTFRDFSSGFITQTGFIRKTNIRSDSTHVNYQWFPKHSLLQSFGTESSAQFAFDHQGNRVYRYLQSDVFMAFARNTVVAPIVGGNSDTLTPLQYGTLTVNRNYAENYVGFVLRSAPLPELSFNIVSINGGNLNYNPLPGAQPSILHQNFLQVLMSIQPFRSLTLDNTYLLDRNHSAADGASAFENQTLRTKINYQFTRALSARVIVEYDSLLVNPAETSLTRTKQVSTSALLTWLPHPGTAIYFGYNNDLQNLSRGLCSRLADGQCDPGNPVAPRSSQYLADGRQIFLKASYLLRF